MSEQLHYHSSRRQAVQAALSDEIKSTRWDDARKRATRVATFYQMHQNERVRRWGDRISGCADQLVYQWARRPAGSETPWTRQLVAARLCRVRTCPICQWRRSLRLQSEVLRAVRHVRAERPGLQAYLLTLTVRNCGVQDLRETCRAMLRGWNLMTKRVQWLSVLGSVRTIEVTPGRRGKRLDAHPHIHAYILTDGPLPRDMSTSVAWRRLWQDVMGLDYMPQCDLRAVSDDGGAIEALKYCAKPGIDPRADSWLPLVGLALDRLRIYASAGIIRTADPDETDDDQVQACDAPDFLADSCPDDMAATEYDPGAVVRIVAGYRASYTGYRRMWTAVQLAGEVCAHPIRGQTGGAVEDVGSADGPCG